MSQKPDVLSRAEAALAWWRSSRGSATSSILGTGAVDLLEREAAELLGHRHGLALPSGTAGLRVALAALGVGHGDEVIVPAFDWGAATAAATSLGARVVTARVEAPTMGISATDVAAKSTARTRAVVVTHLFGVPADTAAVRAVLRPDVAIVEDCAQAFGARSVGRPVGALGDAAVCSFGPGKIIDAGEGGLVACSDHDVHLRMVAATQHPAGQVVRGVDAPDLTNLAARIHPVAAVMACHELTHLDAALELRARARRRVAEVAGRACPDLELSAVAGGSGWGIPALLGSEADVAALAAAGLVARPMVELCGQRPGAAEAAGLDDQTASRAHLLRLPRS